MTTLLKIDFVSDVSCPWCVIGLKSLDQALERVAADVRAELHFQPFELNPQMAPEGQDITEHITEKYGITPAQADANREAIRLRGEQLGFVFSRADQAASAAGLDAARAREILDSDAYAAEVKEREQFYQQHGIHSVPAVIINDRHLISGGQPVEVFEQALRQLAAEAP